MRSRPVRWRRRAELLPIRRLPRLRRTGPGGWGGCLAWISSTLHPASPSADLDEDLAEAEEWNDTERASRLRAEKDFLVRELAAATGLGGRPRQLGSESERARINVTRAIRSAISKIRDRAPDAAAHLDRTIRTGTRCSCNAPDRPWGWLPALHRPVARWLSSPQRSRRAAPRAELDELRARLGTPRTFWRRALFGKVRRRQISDEMPASLRALAALYRPVQPYPVS